MQPAEHTTLQQQQSQRVGRWVTAKVYAATYGLSEDTLGNWRWKDRIAGRSQAAPGYPLYRRFGRAVRYWLDGASA
jgi:hypothetical protein